MTELIRGKRHFAGYEQELDALMHGGLTAEQTKEKLHRIDPAGAKAYRVCALYPQERMTALEEKMYALLNADEALAQACICMEWRRMLIVLLHEAESGLDGSEQIRTLLERAGVSTEGMRIGVSECKAEPEAFSAALNEAVYGARTAKLTKREIVCAKELGLYAYLFPMSENAFVCSQCRSQMKRIRDYDVQNRTSLEQTARVYVAERMEIGATAKALFQHPNTVRYRLTKIQKLMELEDDALFAPMLSLMINLSRILEEEGRA